MAFWELGLGWAASGVVNRDSKLRFCVTFLQGWSQIISLACAEIMDVSMEGGNGGMNEGSKALLFMCITYETDIEMES